MPLYRQAGGFINKLSVYSLYDFLQRQEAVQKNNDESVGYLTNYKFFVAIETPYMFWCVLIGLKPNAPARHLI
jgi:hypothetical protein